MDDTTLRVYVRDETTLARLGQIDDYTALTVVPRYNAVGAYTLEISAGSTRTDLLTEGNGLIIRTAGGDTVMSGPIRTVDWSRSASDGGPGKLTAGGVDDTGLLAQYTCWPSPTAAIGSQTASVYKISAAVAETAMRALVNLNAGPGALTTRKNPRLTLATDGARGGTITRQVNQFDNLLTTLQDIAGAAGLGFRVVQSGTSLQFQVYAPIDRSKSARFSFRLGNLTDASYSTTPPTCTRAVVVAGGGTSPRVCKTYDRTDTLFPGLVIEQFVDLTSVDSASTDLTAQMDQGAEEALTNGAGQGSLSISPIDIPQLRYGRDYAVGDTVAADVRGDWYTDVCREVSLTCTASDGPKVTATVGGDSSGTSSASTIARIYAYIAQVKKDVGRLKTRKAA
ncbi:siphovirus ReqiPepy6 Gp37-like family protein [Streptomyces sp. NPDC008150]|uniref:siphovirus ReqiPepy6 Gp37-like family protein n=1 Tax=Streptomyces sp. NPDC008150 TaxID=3364816 RepID=UPI0036EF67FE